MSGTESSWSFNHKELSHYFSFFHEIVPDRELLSGSRAREFFSLSNLSLSTLAHIWNLSDYDKDGQLNGAEFSLAMNFCQLALDGLQPPLSLPNDLIQLLERSINPNDYIVAMKPNQLEKCTSVFLSFVENNGGIGYLAGEAARYLLTNSQLPKAILFHIWKLADADKDGRLCFKEFVVAMHLVFIAKLNHSLPIQLDPSIILPQEFNATEKKIGILVDQKPLSSNRGILYPVIPTFVLPINNPCIASVFKEIPPEKFLKGKFDNFAGNPFKNELNGNTTYDSHEELSRTNSYSDTSFDSGDVSKLSSSQHSSVKSLVEEKAIQQVQSVDVHLQEVTDHTHQEVTDHTHQEVIDHTHQEVTDHTHQEVTDHTNQEVTGHNHQEEEELEEDNDDGIMDPVEKENMEKELEVISQASANYLKANVTCSTPLINDDSNTEILQTPVMTQTDTSTTTQSQTDTTTQTQSQTDTNTNTQNQSEGIDLSFLDDLQAQVMDVLDDTNSFDPTKVSPLEQEIKPEIKKPPVPVLSMKVPIYKTSSGRDYIDSAGVPLSPSKSKTLPHKRNTKDSYSPFEIRPRKTSDTSTDNIPSYRRNTVSNSPSRKPNRPSSILDDLDDIFSDELAQIDGLMDARKNRGEEMKKRIEKETEDLNEIEKRVNNKPIIPKPKLTTMEEVAKRRDQESAHKQKEWEREFEEKAKQAHDDKMKEKLSSLSDETIQDLESEFQQLIEHEAFLMKDARVIRAQKLKQREQEEIERRDRIKEQMKGKNEVTIEEWIKMMEENKLKEMTPEARVKYEERKKLWLEQRKQKDEERQKMEEEKLRKNREMIEEEYLRSRRLEVEIENNRLTKDELSSLEQDQLRKEAEERKMRSEKARTKMEEIKQKEIENSKPKARSHIAARWEEQVKGRNSKDTVTATHETKSASYREAERLARRVGNI